MYSSKKDLIENYFEKDVIKKIWLKNFYEKDLIFKITINDLIHKKSQDMILELKVWIFLNKQVTNFKFLNQNINWLCYFRKFDIKIRKRFLKNTFGIFENN